MPIIVSTGASDTVPATQADFLALAEEAAENARDALDDLSKNNYIRSRDPVVGDKPDYGISYVAPSGKPTWRFTDRTPGWANIQLNLNSLSSNDVEDNTGDAPATVSPSIPKAPTLKAVSAPGNAPTVRNPTIPSPPVLGTIADPKEWAISLSLVPVINIPSFTVLPPSAGGISAPENNFTWSETPYDSNLLTNTVALVETFNQGGVGIPDVIWEALWARENDRENRAGLKLIDEINSEWSSRGFQLPQGVQVAQIQEIRQKLQSDLIGRARDIAIQEANLEIENLKFAVIQGIALENMKGNWYQQSLQRELEASKFVYSLSVEIFNAEISFYNAQLSAYQVEAEVYKIQIEAELVKLDLYKTELEGQKLIGDLNLQQVQIYKTRVDVLQTTIDLYNAELEGIKLGVEIDSTRIDAYGKEVQAYGEKIRASAIIFDAYKTEMQGAQIETEIYNTNVNAYATRVKAYASRVDADSKLTQTEIEINKLKLLEFDSKLKAFTIEVETASKELSNAVASFDAEHKGYTLSVVNEKSRVDTILQELRNEIMAMSQGTQASIVAAQTDTQAAIAESKLGVEAMKQVASTESTLAGSAMSAVNISQGVNDSAITTSTG